MPTAQDEIECGFGARPYLVWEVHVNDDVDEAESTKEWHRAKDQEEQPHPVSHADSATCTKRHFKPVPDSTAASGC